MGWFPLVFADVLRWNERGSEGKQGSCRCWHPTVNDDLPEQGV